MADSCSVAACGRTPKARGLCSAHYTRLQRHGVIDPSRPVRRTPTVCKVAECDRAGGSQSGYCPFHYQRIKQGIEVDRPRRGGSTFLRDGYTIIYRPGHPNAQANGTISEHRYVMSEALGRPLIAGETVHHKNGDRTDNRPENLELWCGHHSNGQRVADRVADAVETLRRYAPDLLGDAAKPPTGGKFGGVFE